MNATLHNDFSSAGKALAYGHFPLKSYEQMTNQGLRQGWVYLVTFRVHARGKALESSKTYWLIDCYCAWQTRSFFKVDLWTSLLAYQTLDFGMAPPQGSTARRVDWSSTPNELAKLQQSQQDLSGGSFVFGKKLAALHLTNNTSGNQTLALVWQAVQWPTILVICPL